MTATQNALADDDKHQPRTVTVSANGSVDADPDAASITTGVTTNARTAREALRANSKTVSKLIDALLDMGVERKHIQTANINIHPRYNNPKNGSPPTVQGYNVTNDLSIETHDLDNLGEILDQLVSFGANRMHGLSFFVTNSDPLKDEARTKAVANARRRAELFAQAAGANVGRVIHISENTSHQPQPQYRMARTEMAKSSVPIEAGSQELTARVTITWELKD